jgi:hypothetical protein
MLREGEDAAINCVPLIYGYAPSLATAFAPAGSPSRLNELFELSFRM